VAAAKDSVYLDAVLCWAVWAPTDLQLEVVGDVLLSLFILTVRNDRIRSLRIGQSECTHKVSRFADQDGATATSEGPVFLVNHSLPDSQPKSHLLIRTLGFDSLLEGTGTPLSLW